MLGIEDIEAGADGQKDQHDQKTADGGQEHGVLAGLSGFHGEQALHGLLIRAEGGHGAEKAVEGGQDEDIGVGEQAVEEAARPGGRRAGPQLKICILPAPPAMASTAPAPPSMRESRKPMAARPATVKARAWTTLVQTTALMPPQAM